MNTRAQILVEAVDLAAELTADAPHPESSTVDRVGAARPIRVFDVRWTLQQPDGRTAFQAGHLPGAHYLDLDTVLASHGAPQDGRHPLPDPAVLSAWAAAQDLRHDDRIVVCDGGNSMGAARAWWVLRDAGFTAVRILNGGFAAWQAAGLPVAEGAEAATEDGTTGHASDDPHETTAVHAPAQDLRDGQLPTLQREDVAAFVSAGGLLLDARAPERYAGITEPMDPRAGHIPGAVNAPAGEVLTTDGRFADDATLRAWATRHGAAGSAPVAAYCGSGVSAAVTVVALTLAGVDQAALYPGSWSQWSNHPELPAATGDSA